MKLLKDMVAGQALASQAHSITRREKLLHWDQGASNPNRVVWTPQQHKANKEERVQAIEFVMMTGMRDERLATRHKVEA